MAGIDLTNARRSQLLEQLLAQQQQKRAPILSGGELAARLGEQLIRQKQIKKVQGQQAAADKTTRSNEIAVLQKLMGGGDVDFQGRPVVDAQGNQQDKIALAEALGQLSSDNPTGAAITDQLVKQSFKEPKATEPRKSRRRPEGAFTIFEEFNPRTRQWEEVSRSKISQRQQVEQGPPGSFELPGNRDKETLRKRAVLSATGELAESLRNVQANPRATGMVGAAASGANTFGDIPILGKFITTITKEATNLDPAELAEVRTQAEAMVAKLVPVITGDESGRYTDKEQERTRNVQAQSKFWKSGQQVLGGLSELQAIELRGEIRIKGQEGLDFLAGQQIDLSSDEGLEQWGEILMQEYGLPFDKAVNEIDKHTRLLNGEGVNE